MQDSAGMKPVDWATGPKSKDPKSTREGVRWAGASVKVGQMCRHAVVGVSVQVDICAAVGRQVYSDM